MGIVRDLVGRIVSATVTVGIFVGPIAVAALTSIPTDVELLAPPEREPVWFEMALDDGAENVADADVDGEDDGEETEVAQEAVEGGQGVGSAAGAGVGEGQVDGPDAGLGRVAATAVLKGGPAAAGGNRGGRARQASKRRKRKGCDKTYDEIRKVGDQRYVVDRDIILEYTSSLKAFNSLGWSRPNKEEDARGWYIAGFGCNDVLYHAGFRRGDVVLSVNGKKTRTLPQVAILYQTMRYKEDYEVKIIRKGRPMTLHFDVKKNRRKG